jgi:hypothetical protein
LNISAYLRSLQALLGGLLQGAVNGTPVRGIFGDKVLALQAHITVSLIIYEFFMGCLCVKSRRFGVCICDIRVLLAYLS